MSSRVFSFLLALASLAGVAHAQVGPGAPVTTPAPRLERDSDGRPWLFADLDLPTRGATPTERARSVLPQLAELRGRPWVDGAEADDPLLRLRPEGWRYSDALGPWLYSAAVHEAMGEWEPR